MKRIGLVLGVLIFAGTAAAQQLEGLVGHEERELVNNDPAKALAGNYEIDQSHVAVIGRIMHGNLAWLYFRFAPDKITGKYTYDPRRPEERKEARPARGQEHAPARRRPLRHRGPRHHRG